MFEIDTTQAQTELDRMRDALAGLPPMPTNVARTEPGTLDLSERLPDNPVTRVEIITARAACDTQGHPSGCYNPCSDTTYCRCGFVQYPGNCAPFPVARKITPRGKYSPDPTDRQS